ncbi:hypothetical protein FKW77_005027 [Venturia effusa]|uniref:Uncharacterized protein n=1 Tax=Venturia effusa TaxID=50376 RepID=A0A517L379_9PEZI|nr:hypothetical protein FKW77_005027 [Venturia effusa]
MFMLILTSILIVSPSFQETYAAPISSSNATSPVVGFVPQNGDRDTLSLLFSCLLTLGLCVYSAVHLNIPPKNESVWRMRCRELQWCIIGLFGPELVVYAAWRQWSSARELKRQVNGMSYSRETLKKSWTFGSGTITQVESKNVLIDDYTLVHGYYGTMGGFAFERDSFPKNLASEIFGQHKRLTLTPRGVALLAQCGHLPFVSEAEIRDKNKADTVAKVLVCCQAGWMIVQVIARIAEPLPVTLLEVNTIGHVACALAMYLLWWHKPRQINEPTRLEGEWSASLCAYMYLTSQLSGRKHHKMPLNKSSNDTAAGALTCSLIHPAGLGRQEPSIEDTRPGSLSVYKLHVNEADGSELAESPSLSHDLASRAIAAHPALKTRLMCKTHSIVNCSGCTVLTIPAEEFLAPIISDWPTDQLLRRVDSLIMGAILWFATIAYGAIHTAAWNSYFPSTLEKWLWHASSIYVAFSGMVWVVINVAAKIFPGIDALWMRFLHRKTFWLTDVVIILLCTICGLAYIFSRAYLVVEAFVSLRELPKGAYETPSWTQVLPHL